MTDGQNTADDIGEERLREVFGAKVRHLRKLKGWSQDDLARQLDMTLDMIGRLERGKVGASFKTVVRLASLFDVPEYVFFGVERQEGFSGSRNRTLNKISVTLSQMSDAELEKAHKILDALAH